MSDKAKIISIKFLIEKYKKEIKDLKANDNFKNEKKDITCDVLRDIVFDLENLLNANK